jgi:hypothetical protein
MDRVRSNFKNILAVLFGIGLSLVLVESVYRGYLFVAKPPTIYFPGGKSLRPNGQGIYRGGEITLDAFGFRNGYDKSIFLRNRRFLVLGDSVAFGMGVNDSETFVFHLNQHFKSRDIGFINLGRPGRDTHSIRDTLFTYEGALFPYLGIIWIYNINDAKLSDKYYPPNLNSGPIIYSKGSFGKIENTLWPYLQSPSLIKHLTLGIIGQKPSKAELKWQEYYHFCLNTFKKDSEYIKIEKYYLDQVVWLANRRRIPLFLVVVPVLDQFGDTARGPQQFIGQFESENVMVLDILKLFENHPDPGEIYLPNDHSHFSRKGNQMIAKQLSAALEKRMMVIDDKRTEYPDKNNGARGITDEL